jgi:hypothetical protein
MFPPESDLLPPRHRHWRMLVVASVVVLLSVTLDLTPSGGVGLPGIRGSQIPGLCLSQAMFGASCPGCGLTRSFVALGHGRWQESLHYHRAGWVVALLVLVQFPYRALSLAFPRRPLLPRPVPDLCVWAVVGVLVAVWLARLI